MLEDMGALRLDDLVKKHRSSSISDHKTQDVRRVGYSCGFQDDKSQIREARKDLVDLQLTIEDIISVEDKVWARMTGRALPAVLLALTLVTGVVDAVSFLGLGHIFTANMTGNVVFLGFAAAGAVG